MIRFIRRHAVAILFVIVVVAVGLTYHRQENLIAENRELTLKIDAQTDAQQRALCASRVASRTELKLLLLGMVNDFIPAGRPARIELERRIEDALGPPPEDCRDPGA